MFFTSNVPIFILNACVLTLRKTATLLAREGLDTDKQPDWLDYDLLSKWRSGDWMDPLRDNLGAAEIREAIVCDGVSIVPWDLKGNERKIAKNFFLRINRAQLEDAVVAEAHLMGWSLAPRLLMIIYISINSISVHKCIIICNICFW